MLRHWWRVYIIEGYRHNVLHGDTQVNLHCRASAIKKCDQNSWFFFFHTKGVNICCCYYFGLHVVLFFKSLKRSRFNSLVSGSSSLPWVKLSESNSTCQIKSLLLLLFNISELTLTELSSWLTDSKISTSVLGYKRLFKVQWKAETGRGRGAMCVWYLLVLTSVLAHSSVVII